MNRVFVALFVILSFVVSLGAPILSVSAEGIAIVDTQQVLNLSIVGKAARSNLEARIKKAQAKLGQSRSEFEKSKADLEKQAAVLSGSALESKREVLEKKQLELQRLYQDTQQELAKANEEEISRVVKEIQGVVGEVANEKGFSFVFERDRQTVLYASERIDITTDVVKILDNKKIAL